MMNDDLGGGRGGTTAELVATMNRSAPRPESGRSHPPRAGLRALRAPLFLRARDGVSGGGRGQTPRQAARSSSYYLCICLLDVLWTACALCFLAVSYSPMNAPCRRQTASFWGAGGGNWIRMLPRMYSAREALAGPGRYHMPPIT